jgi:hypothetical protein
MSAEPDLGAVFDEHVAAEFEAKDVDATMLYWDQATLLVQLGLLDPSGLPIAGAEQAERLLELAGSE